MRGMINVIIVGKVATKQTTDPRKKGKLAHERDTVC